MAPPTASSADTDTDTDHWTPDLAARVADLYRDLHQHPELSLQEGRTAAAVVEALVPLGLAVTTGVGGHGVVAVLENGEGPVVMLRADMDALPVEEATGLPYASSVVAKDPEGNTVPVAHACGHDMHTAGLVGALHVLSGARDTWAGTIVAVFQPAEELVCGARAMIADGLFERFPVPSIVLGQHVGVLPAGTIGYGSGPIMASSDSVTVTMFGRGGHAAWPETTIDPVVMAAATVGRLQSIVSREMSIHDQAVVTVGRLAAGTKANVIPDTAELGINIRSYSEHVRDRLRAAVERVVRAEAAASGAPREPEFEWTGRAPVLVSDPAATAATLPSLQRLLGADKVFALPGISASEDVGEFGAAISVPTVFWFFGGTGAAEIEAATKDGHAIPFNHSPGFAPVIEPTLTTGVRALAAAALHWLGAATPSSDGLAHHG